MTTIITTTGLSLHFKTAKLCGIKDPTADQMRQCLRLHPHEASAEANSLLRIAEPDDDLILLYTSGSNAALCVKLLKDFFQGQGYKYVSLKEMSFQANAHHIERTGSSFLINAIIDEIERAQTEGKEVVINATAGFKIEIAYSTIIGMAYQIPIKYIYEDFGQVVTLAPIPVIWDVGLFLFNESFFRWVKSDLHKSNEVEKRLQAMPEADQLKVRPMLMKEEGYTLFSPMGNVFFRRFAYEATLAQQTDWPADAAETDAIKKLPHTLRHSGHKYPKRTFDVARKIAEEKWVEEITAGNFENTVDVRVKAGDDRGMIVVLWADNEKATRLMIRTTAKGGPQTYKVTERIKEIVEEF